MKLGFLTACFRNTNVEQIVPWTGANGFKAIEISCMPVTPGTTSGQYSLEGFNKDKAAALKEICDKAGVSISCLTYCDNNLAADIDKRQKIHAHLYKVIDAAALLNVNNVSTFVGRNENLSVRESANEAANVFRDILSYAADKNVRIAIENWPGLGWPKEGQIGNIFASPVIWESLFEALPVDNFGLNFDPSHLYWQGIDYLKTTRDFRERIFHVHVKDTEIFTDRLSHAGNLLPGSGWYRYRIPGYGNIEWPRFISILAEAGYDGALSIEHEDAVWSGTDEKVKQGLLLGNKYLSTYVV